MASTLSQIFRRRRPATSGSLPALVPKLKSKPKPKPEPIPSAQPQTPKTETLRQAITSIYRESDLDRLISRFKAASAASSRFLQRRNVYEYTVRRLTAGRRGDAIVDILEDQKTRISKIAQESFAARIISLYGMSGMPDRAVSTFHQLPSLGAPRTVISFNALLAVLAADSPERAVTTFESTTSKFPDIIPNTVSYNTAIYAVIKKGDIDAALGLFSSMEKATLTPDVVTFNTLLNGLYQNDRFDDGEQLWAAMADKKCQPNVMSYNARMRGMASQGKISEAMELLTEMEERGLEPDSYSFTALIACHCKCGDLANAKNVFDEMRTRELPPTRGAYKVLVPQLCEAGEMDKAFVLCRESISRRKFVTVEMLQILIDKLVEVGMLEEAKELVKFAQPHRYFSEKLRMPSAYGISDSNEIQLVS